MTKQLKDNRQYIKDAKDRTETAERQVACLPETLSCTVRDL